MLRTKATFSEAKDEAGNDYNDILWMLQKSCSTWDGAKTLVNHGINYQPQLVSLPDSIHPQYHESLMCCSSHFPGGNVNHLSLGKRIVAVPIFRC